jgi:hypothetical protein
VLVLAGRGRELDRVGVERVGDEDPVGQADLFRHGVGVGDRTEVVRRAAGRGAAQHLDLDRLLGVPDRELHQEAVQLRLRQAVRAVHLDRVLRGDDEERARHTVAVPVDRDVALLHDLEQRRLGLRRGPIDLVRHDDVGEDGSAVELELARSLIEDRDAGDVGGQQVRGELDPAPLAAYGGGDGAGQRCLADAGDVLDQQMALGEEPGERQPDHLGLAEHDRGDVGRQPGSDIGEALHLVGGKRRRTLGHRVILHIEVAAQRRRSRRWRAVEGRWRLS